MKEEKYIMSKTNCKNPFRVPEGYFDNFAAQMMDKLPDREPVAIPARGSRLRVLRPMLYAAACICVVVFCLAAYFTKTFYTEPSNNDIAATINHAPYSSTYEDEIIDYAMMDNTDIYAYLSNE